MRLRSQSRENVLNHDSKLHANSTLDDLDTGKKTLFVNEATGTAPREKLASVSIQYRRHRGRQMSTICEKKGVSDLAFSNLIDNPIPQQDQIMKNRPLKRKMCPRELMYQQRSKDCHDETFRPIYHTHANGSVLQTHNNLISVIQNKSNERVETEK